MLRRVTYDVDLLRGGGWVLWRTSGPRERVVAEGRFRPVGRLVYWHRRLLWSRPPPPPRPEWDLFGCGHVPQPRRWARPGLELIERR